MSIRTLTAWVRMVRLPIMFLCCFGAVVGALNTAVFLNTNLSFFQIFMLILVPAFLSIGTMIHSDVTELESDKVNRPNKPLPAGVIKEKTAYYTGFFLMFSSIFLALFIYSCQLSPPEIACQDQDIWELNKYGQLSVNSETYLECFSEAKIIDENLVFIDKSGQQHNYPKEELGYPHTPYILNYYVDDFSDIDYCHQSEGISIAGPFIQLSC